LALIERPPGIRVETLAASGIASGWDGRPVAGGSTRERGARMVKRLIARKMTPNKN
jgi:hypothetical protein